MRFPYLCFLSPSILNKCDKRDSELERDNMSKCCKFWKYVFPNCAAWCWPDDKGPTTRCRHSAGKPRSWYVQLLFIIRQVLSKGAFKQMRHMRRHSENKAKYTWGFSGFTRAHLVPVCQPGPNRGPPDSAPFASCPSPCRPGSSSTYRHTCTQQQENDTPFRHQAFRLQEIGRHIFFPNQLHKLN